jgi:hypothetical protein
MSAWAAEPATWPSSVIVTATWELRGARSLTLLPKALRPTAPALLTLVAVDTGEFRMVTARLSCRAGVRPRAFVLAGAVDGVKPELFHPWGMSLASVPIAMDVRFDRTRVSVGDHSAFELDSVNPMAPHDVQYVVGLHPFDDNLVQVEVVVAPSRVERCRPSLVAFDATAWGDARLEPVDVVVGTVVHGAFTLPAIRYVT